MRKVYFEFSSTGIKVPATVVEGATGNDKLIVDKFWAKAQAGEKFAIAYTLIAGHCFLATCKPGPEYPYITPDTMLSIFDAEAGQVHFDGQKLRCTYGSCTEPLPVPYALSARVDSEYLDDWVKACEDAWYNCFFNKILCTITMTAEEV